MILYTKPIKAQTSYKTRPALTNETIFLPKGENQQEINTLGTPATSKGFLSSYYKSPKFYDKYSRIEDDFGWTRNPLRSNQHYYEGLSALVKDYDKDVVENVIGTELEDLENTINIQKANYSTDIHKKAKRAGDIMGYYLRLPITNTRSSSFKALDAIMYPADYHDYIKGKTRKGSEGSYNFLDTKIKVDNLRAQSYLNGIFDARTQEFTQDTLKKALENKNTKPIIDDLRKTYSDEEIINILRSMASNKQRNGGSYTV